MAEHLCKMNRRGEPRMLTQFSRTELLLGKEAMNKPKMPALQYLVSVVSVDTCVKLLQKRSWKIWI